MSTTGRAPVRDSRVQVRSKDGRISLTAASRRLVEPGKRGNHGDARTTSGWQNEAWGYFDTISEIRTAVRHFGDAMSKLRIYVAWDDPTDSNDPIPVLDEDGNVPDQATGLTPKLAQAAVAELARLDAHSSSGMSGLIRRMNLQFEIPGECYLVGRAATGTSDEVWEIRSLDEVHFTENKTLLKDRPDQQETDMTVLDVKADGTGTDTIARMWIEHPRWADLADSWMQPALIPCRSILGLMNEIVAETNSQKSAGLLLMPNDIDEGPIDMIEDEDDDVEDQFYLSLEAALIDPIENPESPAAVAPTLIRGPVDSLEKVRHMHLGRDRSQSIIQTLDSLVLRLARGANMPVEVIEGHMQTTFANAEQIDQDKWDDHYQPRAELIEAVWTHVYLRPQLLDQGFPEDAVAKVVVKADGSALIRQPDTEGNAKEAHSALAISDAALRRATGFGEEDAPDEEELLRRMASRAGLASDVSSLALVKALLDQAGILTEADPVEPPAALPSPAEDDDSEDEPIAASSRPVSTLGRDLMEIDRDLRMVLTAAANAAAKAAENRLGAKLCTSRKVREVVTKAVPHRDVARTAGRAVIEQAGFAVDELVFAEFDVIEEMFREQADQAAQAAFDRIVAEFPAAEDEAAYARDRIADRIEPAARWLHERLSEIIDQHVFAEPSLTAAVDDGEGDTGIIPSGVLRQAIALAGSDVAFSDDGGAFIAILANGLPAGGIATGTDARNVIAAGGGSIDRYRWVYGPGRRLSQFEPHRRLDGVIFTGFDDDALRVDGDWPNRSHYMPGDHKGCKCDYELVIERTERADALSDVLSPVGADR